MLILVLIQIGIADRIFYVYADQNDWNVPAGVMIAFLIAAVVEVIVIAAIIAKYLFKPNPDARRV